MKEEKIIASFARFLIWIGYTIVVLLIGMGIGTLL